MSLLKRRISVLGSIPDYLCFTALQAGSTVLLSTYRSGGDYDSAEYSRDGRRWVSMEHAEVITLSNIGDKVFLRGNLPMPSSQSETQDVKHEWFSLTGLVAASGNLASLYSKELEPMEAGPYVFKEAFAGQTALVTPPKLGFTKSSFGTFRSMFSGCTSLIRAADMGTVAEIGSYSCQEMYKGCTALVDAAPLPATAIGYMGCREMYAGCPALSSIPAIHATNVEYYGLGGMFSGDTAIMVADTADEVYKNPWRIPMEGTVTTASSWSRDMLSGTGGTRTSNPSKETTYYTANEVV